MYYQPSDFDVTVIDYITRFRAVHQQPMIITEYFNVHHQDWLCSTHTSIAGRGLLDFVNIMIFPTFQAGISAESYPGCFCCGLFLSPVICPQVLGWSLNDSISTG